MADFRIPIARSSQAFTTQRTVLDGSTFRIDFQWNSRISRWLFSLYTSDDVAILQGRPFVNGWPLLHGVSNPLRPPGELFLFTPDDIDPDLEGIDRATLLYREAE